MGQQSTNPGCIVILAAIRKAEILNLEDHNNMHNVHGYMASLLLAAAIAAPVSIIAAPAPQGASTQVRVYDTDHKDYHNWDDNENKAWGVYLTDNKKKAHTFTRSSKKEQSDYWNWRHDHPDHD